MALEGISCAHDLQCDWLSLWCLLSVAMRLNYYCSGIQFSWKRADVEAIASFCRKIKTWFGEGCNWKLCR